MVCTVIQTYNKVGKWQILALSKSFRMIKTADISFQGKFKNALFLVFKLQRKIGGKIMNKEGY